MSVAEKLFTMGFGGFSRLAPNRASNVARKLMMTPRRSTGKSWEDLPAADQDVDLGNDSFLSIWHGGPKAVLIVHGWEGRISQFAPIINELDRKTFTIYALHPAGHGLSTAREGHPGRFIEAIRRTVDYVGKPIHTAVGHSMGAGVLCYVQAHHQVFGSLVLISGPAHFAGVLKRFARFLNLGPRAESRFLAAVADHVQIPVEDLDLSAMGDRIPQPVLVIHDQQDKEIPFDDALLLTSRLPHGQLLKTEGLGHHRLLNDSLVVRSASAFINGFSD